MFKYLTILDTRSGHVINLTLMDRLFLRIWTSFSNSGFTKEDFINTDSDPLRNAINHLERWCFKHLRTWKHLFKWKYLDRFDRFDFNDYEKLVHDSSVWFFLVIHMFKADELISKIIQVLPIYVSNWYF